MPTPIVLLLLLCFITPGFGQSALPDSAFIPMASREAIAAYERTLNEQAHIYVGNEYIAHDPRIKVHPYYISDNMQAGTIHYNGVRYQHVEMLYDIVRSELSIKPPGGGYRLRVRNEYISDFTLGDHRFSRIVGDSATGLTTDFYEILYNGPTKALSHRQKTVHEDISSGSYQAEYVPKDRFYILKSGVYHEIKSKRSMLNLFPEQAKTLRKFIRSNELKFNDNQREEAVKRVTQRYDELTK
ncbi:hypothetical protein [Spirosoma aerophilum]